MVRESLLFAFLIVGTLAFPAKCQERAEPPRPSAPVPKIDSQAVARKVNHRFWDKENAWVFTGVAASHTHD